MKILELRADNFARLKAVSIRPDDAVVPITGQNGQGKTSCLNAIWTALEGKAVAPAVPIRKGCEQARIRLTLGTDEGVEATVTRTFSVSHDPDGQPYTSELKLELAGGKAVRAKPQALIDSWLGSITIDPLQFARAKPKDQFDALKVMIKGFDFDENAKARKAAFDERTDVNRVATQQRTMADRIEVPAGKVPAAEPDVSALADELRVAMAHNAEIDARKARRASAQASIDRLRDDAEAMRAKAASMEKEADGLAAKLAAAEALPDPMDLGVINGRMLSASADAKIWTATQQRKQHEAAATEAEREAAHLTTRIQNLDEDKIEAIERAKLPVPGLSLGDDMVLLNGLPFSQAGTAEKLRTSIAVGMAGDPALRIMLIDEGSELDQNGLAIVREMAEAADYQIWMARVEDGGKTGFVIVDGEVAP